MSSKKNILIIILAVVFGLAAGIVGEMFGRAYLSDNIYNLPLGGEINLPPGSGPNIIIRNPKKVVVEQNDKVIETINSVQGSIAGIFKKSAAAESAAKNIIFNLSNYYKLNQKIGEGLIITSDGWLITNSKLDSLGYVVITQDKKIYQVDKIVSDPLTPFYFIHVQAQDLPVRKFAERSEIENGQLILAVNWNGEAELNTTLNNNDIGDGFLYGSDVFPGKMVLVAQIGKRFNNSFLFNLYGDIVGLARQDGEIEPISHFSSAILSLLKNKEIKRPTLGVNYINLSQLVDLRGKNETEREFDRGALIYKDPGGIAVIKGSPAAMAGLKENDVIISVEEIEINKDNNLADVIGSLSAGDAVDITFLRQGEEREISVVLGETGIKSK